MSTIIELPQVGESVTEGVINRWLKQPGEHVDKYDPLVEIMTDKVNMEVPSPYTGTLVRTLAAEGDTVPMGDPIAEMELDEPASAAPASSPSADSSAALSEAGEGRDAAEHFEFVESMRSVGPTGSGEGGEGRPDLVRDEEVRRHAAEHVSHEGARLSPLVRRLVAEHGIDHEQVRGTGRGGRVTKDDILLYVAERGAAGDGDHAASARAVSPRQPETSVRPLTPLRRMIADHLTRSAREIPAAWSMMEVDVSGLLRLRASRRDAFQRTNGISLTYLPFAAHAVAQELSGDPLLNGRWEGDSITLNHRVHLGIAVSTDQGLVVPVVHDADRLSIEGLAVRINELVEAARAGTLQLADVQGGTFTLNNTGALGSVVSVPVINHPQAAILTTEAIVKRPVVIEGDAIDVRSMMNICMTFDHRICDGAEAGRFLDAVKKRLEAMDQGSPLM
jgi:2-oxoisovalerate dehydrogenase E2 component (dihydrolipoyl transacylase)